MKGSPTGSFTNNGSVHSLELSSSSAEPASTSSAPNPLLVASTALTGGSRRSERMAAAVNPGAAALSPSAGAGTPAGAVSQVNPTARAGDANGDGTVAAHHKGWMQKWMGHQKKREDWVGALCRCGSAAPPKREKRNVYANDAEANELQGEPR